MLKALADYARKHGMFPPGCTVVCAVSGGADSMALLCALRAISPELGIGSLVAAHYNHMLRGEFSDRDERFVREFCRLNGVDFVCGRGDVGAQAKKNRAGIEETARAMRYEFLQRTAGNGGIIATAHTADDNAETVLLSLCRGAGLQGLCGIPPVRGNIVRPLLFASRAQILQYLDSVGVDFMEDETNRDVAYARNRLRHTVLPLLKRQYPALTERIGAAAAHLREDLDFIQSQAEISYGSLCGKTDEGILCDASALRALPAALSSRVLLKMYQAAAGHPGSLSSRHICDLHNLVQSMHPSAKINLPGGIVARRDYTRLILGKTIPLPAGFSPLRLTQNAQLRIPGTQYSVFCRPAQKSEEIHNFDNTFYLNCDMIHGNLYIRPRMEGDRLSSVKSGGTKSLKKLMIDYKIPRDRRVLIPVLADDLGVAAVAGFGPDRRCAASSPDRALYVEFIKGA